MAINYAELGQRIANFRNKGNLSQEELAFRCEVGHKYISNIELGKSKPSLESLVQIANILNVSADDLLVDSLTHSTSTADTEIHRLLLDCNSTEQEILTRMVKEMKAILYGLGI